jgi:integrase
MKIRESLASLQVTQMPKPSKLKPHHDVGRRAPWRVDIAARFSLSGRRERYFFAAKAEAENYALVQRVRIANYGVQGASILPPAQQEQAANALRLLQPYGVSLNEVAQDWLYRRKASEASITYEAAMDAFLDWRKRSESYTRSIRQTRNRLTGLHGKLLNTITPADLTRSMDGMPPSVRNFTLGILGGLFNFGAKRGFCGDNPVHRLDLSQREPTEIQLHTVEEVGRIMAAAEKHIPGLVPFFAISFFCGVRRAEALRLDWSAIDLHENFVKLPAAITKTKRGRHIEISENCRAWLVPYAQEGGRIFPYSGDVLRNRLAGLGEKHKVPTIKHGPRHSFASYWLAMHNDIDQLCLFLGHNGPQTTFRHYAKAATKREAQKFWAIMPKAVPKVVAFPPARGEVA